MSDNIPPTVTHGLSGKWFQAAQSGAITFCITCLGFLMWHYTDLLVGEIQYNRTLAEQFQKTLINEREHDREQRNKTNVRIRELVEEIRLLRAGK